MTSDLSTVRGPGVGSIHLLLPQEEQIVLLSGKEVTRTVGSRGQTLGTLRGLGKKDPSERPLLLCHASSR